MYENAYNVPIEVRTKRELRKIYSFSYKKVFYCDYSHTYVIFLQIIINNIEKVRWIISNTFSWFLFVRIRGHRTWRRDFPAVGSWETCIYLFHIVEIDSCLFLGVQFNYIPNEYNTIPTV